MNVLILDMENFKDFVRRPSQNVALLAALAFVGGGVVESKADLSYTISDASLETVTVDFQGNNYDVLAGGIGLTAVGSTGGAPSKYVSVCTDFEGTLYIGKSYQYASPVSTSSALSSPSYSPAPAWGPNGAAAIQNAATLFANYSSVLTSGNFNEAAGLQLAIWTALYDSSAVGSVTLSGNPEFAAVSNNGDSSAVGYMNTYLDSLSSLTPSTSVQMFLPSPDSSQNGPNPDGQPPQALLLYAPVPEASTVVTASLLLLSFGVCSLKSFGKPRA